MAQTLTDFLLWMVVVLGVILLVDIVLAAVAWVVVSVLI